MLHGQLFARRQHGIVRDPTGPDSPEDRNRATGRNVILHLHRKKLSGVVCLPVTMLTFGSAFQAPRNVSHGTATEYRAVTIEG